MTEAPAPDPFDEPAEAPPPPPPEEPQGETSAQLQNEPVPPAPIPAPVVVPPGFGEGGFDATAGEEFGGEAPTYSAEDMAASAQLLGIQPWDAAAIYTEQGKTEMTMPEFEAALARWRTPQP